MSETQAQQIFYDQNLQAWLEQFVAPEGSTDSGFPSTVEAVRADVVALFKSEDRIIRPDEMKQRLLEQYLPGEDHRVVKDLINEIERSQYGSDSTLRSYYAKEHTPLLTAFSNLFAVETGKPVLMFECDFANMGGTNELMLVKYAQQKGLIGLEDGIEALTDEMLDSIDQDEYFKFTDDAMRLLSEEILVDIQKEVPDARIIPVRTGGDEIRLFVEGIDPDQDVKELRVQMRQKMHQSVLKVSSELGLLDHAQPKDQHNKFRNGFVLAIEGIDMREIKDPAHVIVMLDELIKEHKEVELGQVNIGEFTEDQEQKLRHDIEREIKIRKQDLPDHVISKLVEAAVDQHKENLQKQSQDLHALGPQESMSLEEYEGKLAELRTKMDERGLTIQGTRPDRLKLSNLEAGALDNFPRPKDIRLHLVEEELKAAGIELPEGGKAAQLLENAIESMTPFDNSAGTWRLRDLVNAADVFESEKERIMDGLPPEERARLGDPKTRIIALAVHNLGGLNNDLGHANADAVLRGEVDDVIKRGIAQAGIEGAHYEIAHNGGGEFSVVFQPLYQDESGAWQSIPEEQIKQATQNITQNMERFASQNVLKYLEDKGISVAPELADAIRDTTFNDIQDPKERRFRLPDSTLHNDGKINGVNVVVVDGVYEHNPDNPAQSIKEASKALDRAVSKDRTQRLVANHEASSLDHNGCAQNVGQVDIDGPERSRVGKVLDAVDGVAGKGLSAFSLSNVYNALSDPEGTAASIGIAIGDGVTTSVELAGDFIPRIAETSFAGIPLGSALEVSSHSLTFLDAGYQLAAQKGVGGGEAEIDDRAARLGALGYSLGSSMVLAHAVKVAGISGLGATASLVAPAIIAGMSADKAVDTHLAIKEVEHITAQHEQANKIANEFHADSGAPKLTNYEHLKHFAYTEATLPGAANEGTLQDRAAFVKNHNFSEDPELVQSIYEEALQKVEGFDAQIEDLSSVMPDVARIGAGFGLQDDVLQRQDLEAQRAPYIAVLADLHQYRQELEELAMKEEISYSTVNIEGKEAISEITVSFPETTQVDLAAFDESAGQEVVWNDADQTLFVDDALWERYFLAANTTQPITNNFNESAANDAMPTPSPAYQITDMHAGMALMEP
ncbi:MAG: hypothetical protein ACLFU1_04835 [Alphaproteobacteria bacterium]